MRRMILCLVLFLCAGLLFAEISPDSYQWLQDNSPERLIIEVIDVRTPFISCSKSRSVTVLAQVVRIEYSDTSLSVGDEITITYSNFKPGSGWVGPRPIPILDEGTQCPAFLQFDDESDSYIPAAKGYSFEFVSYEGRF